MLPAAAVVFCAVVFLNLLLNKGASLCWLLTDYANDSADESAAILRKHEVLSGWACCSPPLVCKFAAGCKCKLIDDNAKTLLGINLAGPTTSYLSACLMWSRKMLLLLQYQ